MQTTSMGDPELLGCAAGTRVNTHQDLCGVVPAVVAKVRQPELPVIAPSRGGGSSRLQGGLASSARVRALHSSRDHGSFPMTHLLYEKGDCFQEHRLDKIVCGGGLVNVCDCILQALRHTQSSSLQVR